MDEKNSLFAGQILAEMLAGVCHEKHYRYSDQEVCSFNRTDINNRPLRYLSLIPRFNYGIVLFRRNILVQFMIGVLLTVRRSNYRFLHYMTFAILFKEEIDLIFSLHWSNICEMNNRRWDFSITVYQKIWYTRYSMTESHVSYHQTNFPDAQESSITQSDEEGFTIRAESLNV